MESFIVNLFLYVFFVAFIVFFWFCIGYLFNTLIRKSIPNLISERAFFEAGLTGFVLIVVLTGFFSSLSVPVKYVSSILTIASVAGAYFFVRRWNREQIKVIFSIAPVLVLTSIVSFYFQTNFVWPSPFAVRQGVDMGHYMGLADYLWNFGGTLSEYNKQNIYFAEYIEGHLGYFARIGTFGLLSSMSFGLGPSFIAAMFNPMLAAIIFMASMLVIWNTVPVENRKLGVVSGLLSALVAFNYYNVAYPYLGGAVMLLLFCGAIIYTFYWLIERRPGASTISILCGAAIGAGYTPGWPFLIAGLGACWIFSLLFSKSGNLWSNVISNTVRVVVVLVVFLIATLPVLERGVSLLLGNPSGMINSAKPRYLAFSDFVGLSRGHMHHFIDVVPGFTIQVLSLIVIFLSLWGLRKFRNGYVFLAVGVMVPAMATLGAYFLNGNEKTLMAFPFKAFSYSTVLVTSLLMTGIAACLINVERKIVLQGGFLGIKAFAYRIFCILLVVLAVRQPFSEAQFHPGYITQDIPKGIDAWLKENPKPSSFLVPEYIGHWGYHTYGPLVKDRSRLLTIRDESPENICFVTGYLGLPQYPKREHQIGIISEPIDNGGLAIFDFSNYLDYRNNPGTPSPPFFRGILRWREGRGWLIENNSKFMLPISKVPGETESKIHFEFGPESVKQLSITINQKDMGSFALPANGVLIVDINPNEFSNCENLFVELNSVEEKSSKEFGYGFDIKVIGELKRVWID